MLNRVMMLWIYLAILAGITRSRRPPASEPSARRACRFRRQRTGGSNAASRPFRDGHPSTLSSHRLVVRNMADAGNTPGFRPHSGRPNPYRFPGAETFRKPSTKPRIDGDRVTLVLAPTPRPISGWTD